MRVSYTRVIHSRSKRRNRERERSAQSLVSGPTLSEATPDGPSDDALQWIQNMRNKTTALNAKSAEKKAREWDELEGSAKPSSYASGISPAYATTMIDLINSHHFIR